MRAARAIAAVAVGAALLTGCGTDTPDYQSIWDSSTTSTTAEAAQAPEKPVPIALYLEQNGVIGAPMTPATLTGIKVTVPRPAGWEVVNDPNLPNSYEVLRKSVDSGYPPTALVMVFKLTGDFDVTEAISHGYADAEMAEGFSQLNASTDDFNGHPSSMIEGSYTLTGQRLHIYNRVIIPTSAMPAADRFLVQFTVTTSADQAAAHADDVEELIKGFAVTVT